MKKRNITLFTAFAAAAALAPTAQAGTLVEHSRNGGVYSTTELNTAGGYAVGVLDTSDSLYHTSYFEGGFGKTNGPVAADILTGGADFLAGAQYVAGDGSGADRDNISANDNTYRFTFDQPGTFYLLADNRHTPTWFGTDGYTDTTVNIAHSQYSPVADYNVFSRDVVASQTFTTGVYGGSFEPLGFAFQPSGIAAPFAITEIQYAPDAEPDPTVTLTWRSRPGTTYGAFSSLDLSDWSNELADSLGPDTEGIIVDGDLLTMTFPLDNGLENATDLFFRIQEE